MYFLSRLQESDSVPPPLACLFCIKQISYDGAITCCNAPSTNRLYNAHILEFCRSLPYVHMPGTLRVCVCARACAYMHICGRGNMHASCVYLDMSIDTYVCEHMLAPLRTHVFANITFHSELHINALVNQQRSLLENTLKYFSVFLNCFYI